MAYPKQILFSYGLYPKKRLGQNFLTDTSLVKLILQHSDINSEDIVLEIGPGLGALTVPLSRLAREVMAVETDSQIIVILQDILRQQRIENVRPIHEDILKMDICELSNRKGKKLAVFGNLPYNISSQIVVKLIHERNGVDRAVIMLQKEMAQRLTASPGNRQYGRLTAMLSYCADVRVIADVKSNRFYPRPEVDSSVILIRFKTQPEHPATDEKHLFKIIKAGFGNRRKTLKNALSGSEFKMPKELAGRILTKADIDPLRRAETLSVEEFVRLSEAAREELY